MNRRLPANAALLLTLGLACGESTEVTGLDEGTGDPTGTETTDGGGVDCDQGAFAYSLSYAPLDGVGNEQTQLFAPRAVRRLRARGLRARGPRLRCNFLSPRPGTPATRRSTTRAMFDHKSTEPRTTLARMSRADDVFHDPAHDPARDLARAVPWTMALALTFGCGDTSEVPQDSPVITAVVAATGATATTAAVGSGAGSESSWGAAGDSATGPVPECFDDGECSAATPFCWQGQCVECDQVDDGDAACAELDPTRPACVAGRCEVCSATEASQCVGATPACDPTTNTCVGCMDHDDCPGGRGCHILEQRCLGGGVYEVEPGGAYSSIHDALADLLEAGNEGTIVIHRAGGMSKVLNSIPPGAAVALVAGAGGRPEVSRWGYRVRVQPVGVAYIDGIDLFGSDPNNLLAGVGVSIAGGTAYMTRTRSNRVVVDNGGSLHLINSIVAGSPAVDVVDGTAEILYSTLISGPEPSDLALRCGQPAAVTVRNSVMTRGAVGTTVDCDQGAFSYSLSYAPLEGVGNQRTSLIASELFADYWDAKSTTYLRKDYPLTVEGFDATFDVGRWNTGDPVVDFHGDARPQYEGAPDHAGADVPGL